MYGRVRCTCEALSITMFLLHTRVGYRCVWVWCSTMDAAAAAAARGKRSCGAMVSAHSHFRYKNRTATTTTCTQRARSRAVTLRWSEHTSHGYEFACYWMFLLCFSFVFFDLCFAFRFVVQLLWHLLRVQPMPADIDSLYSQFLSSLRRRCLLLLLFHSRGLCAIGVVIASQTFRMLFYVVSSHTIMMMIIIIFFFFFMWADTAAVLQIWCGGMRDVRDEKKQMHNMRWRQLLLLACCCLSKWGAQQHAVYGTNLQKIRSQRNSGKNTIVHVFFLLVFFYYYFYYECD